MKHDLKKLFSFLKNMLPLNAETRHHMESNPFIKKKESIRRKCVFADAGAVAEHAGFLEEGFATAYRKNGDTWVVSWMKAAPCEMIPENFFTGDRCSEKIVLKAGSTYVYVCRNGIQQLFEKAPQTQDYLRLVQEQHLRETEEEKMLLRGLSAKEKYAHLATTRPEVLHHASLKDIASYLGIRLRQLYNIRKAYGKE